MNRANASNMDKNRMGQSNPLNIRWMLVLYDLIIYAVVAGTMLVLYEGMDKLFLCCVFFQHVLLAKYMNRYGDMAGYNVISFCFLPTLLLL